MSDQEDKLKVLQGMLRQSVREAAATEIYLKAQIRQLKERTADEQRAFKGGWVARDSGGTFDEIDEWYATWVEDEERKL